MRSAVTAAARGKVVLTASDRDLSVTLSFATGRVDVSDGGDDDSRAPSMAGPWLELAHVCSGQRSPVRAIAAGELHVAPRGHPARLLAAGFALSAPATREQLTRRWLAAGVALATLALLWSAGHHPTWHIHDVVCPVDSFKGGPMVNSSRIVRAGLDSGAGVMLMSGNVPRGALCSTNDVSRLIEELQYAVAVAPDRPYP